MSSIRPKRIYLARRHPRLDERAFVHRWREHGALAMDFMARQRWENVVRYAQCDAVRDHGLPAVSSAFDGVGMIWFRDLDARARHSGFAEARAALVADEDEVFDVRVNQTGLFADENVQIDRGGARVALVRVLQRPEGVGADAFVRQWREAHGPALCKRLGDTLRRYVQNVPLPPDEGTQWGLAADLVDEVWFESVEALRAAWSRAGESLALLDDRSLAKAATLVVVEETVLHSG